MMPWQRPEQQSLKREVVDNEVFLIPPRRIKYSGMAKMPKKVYEGDSRNITLLLKRDASTQEGLHTEALSSTYDERGCPITFCNQ